MLTGMRQIFNAPVFEDEEKTRAARFLNVTLLAAIVMMAGLIVIESILGAMKSLAFMSSIFLVFFMVGMLLLLHRGYVKRASFLFVLMSWLDLTFQAWTGEAVRDEAFVALIIIALLANLLLGWRTGVLFAVLSILAGWVMVYAETIGVIEVSISRLPSAVETALVLTVVFGLATVATILTMVNLTTALQRARSSEVGLVERNRELEEIKNSLEEQVAERTQNLKVTMEIGRQMTTILDINELLQYFVDRLQKEFNFYHTQIYLIEKESGDLVLAEGFGEVGRQLKERGHRLPVGQGIVGTVASLGEHFLSNNVTEVLNFVSNPLLSDTNSELAVPLRKGDQVLGVLDIQSKQLNRFSAEDVSLMQAIANQAAIAIDNARLLSETQVVLKEVERLNRQLTREAWQQFGEEVTTSGYRFVAGSRKKITPASDAWLAPMKQAAVEKQLVKQTQPGNGDPAKAELAVPLLLRGEVIGVLGVKREQTPDWAAEEIAAVEAVANQVALALENARLSKEQEKTIVHLKDIDRLKSEFLTSMSHELRTPLNSIIGFADVLLQGIDGELNDLALNDIQLIHNSGKHLLALINDVLDLAKIEAGKMELVREAVDIKDIANAVLASSHSLVKDKPVEIITDVSDMLPPVYADKLRLNQILLNLVSNAAKFTHEGTITIKASLNPRKLDVMTIAVIDTGIGIPASKLGSIFERFRQADNSTTRKYGGTGLGLAICKQLIEMHGGTLNVRSEEGVGSEFYFTIPLA